MRNTVEPTQDRWIIRRIARRAVKNRIFGGERKARVIVRDITIAHRARRIDLDRLLTAHPFAFAADIRRITNYLDRETGEFIDGIQPRFTV
jgi:hypothetical protein